MALVDKGDITKEIEKPKPVNTHDISDQMADAWRKKAAKNREAKGLPPAKRVLSKAQIAAMMDKHNEKRWWAAVAAEDERQRQELAARLLREQEEAAVRARELIFARAQAAEAAQAATRAKQDLRAAKKRKQVQAQKVQPKPKYDALIPARGEVFASIQDKVARITFPVTTDRDEMIAYIKRRIEGAYDGEFSFTVTLIDRDNGPVKTKIPTGRLNSESIKNAVFGTKNKKMYEGYDAIEFHIWREVKGEKQDLALRDSVRSNCVIDAIAEFYQLRYGGMNDAKSKKLKKIVEKYRLHENPVTGAILSEMGRTLRHHFVVYDAAGHIWKDTGGHQTLINIFAQRGHGSLHVPLIPAKKVEYGNPVALTEKMHQQKKLFVRLNDGDLSPQTHPIGVHTGDTIYKSFRPSSVTGNPLDDDTPEYFDCMDADQYKFRRWKKDNNLRALSGVYFDIFRNADSHLTTQQFMQLDDKNHHLYDMNRAYPSFKTNPLYDQYKITVGYVTLYDARGVDQSKILDHAGVSFVSSIVYHDPLVEKTGWIQAGQWYNNICLFVLVREKWATIEITQTCICRQPEDLVFPFEESKLYNNKFIGRLVSGASATSRPEYYLVHGPQDVKQLMYEFERDKPRCTNCYTIREFSLNETIGDREPVYVVADMRVDDARSQLHQIHGCILAYQQVTFMMAMVFASKLTRIIAYNTDGFHVQDKIPLKLSKKPGGFKYEHKPIKYQSSYHPMEPRPFEVSWDINRLPVYEKYELPIVLITGPAGCGKSYMRIEVKPGVQSVVLCPTNSLVANTTERTKPEPVESDPTDELVADQTDPTSVMVTTYQKFFGIWLNSKGERPDYHKQMIPENVIFDEITIAPGVELQEVIEKCQELRMCLDLIGDVRKLNGKWITDQMKPVNDKITLDDCLRKLTFTHKEVISDVRRQSPEESAWIDSLRGDPNIRQRIVDRFGIKNWQDVCTRDILGVASRHKICTAFGYDMIDRFDLKAVRARCVVTRRKDGKITEPKGAISWQPVDKVWLHRKSFDQETPKSLSYEMAFFRTAHAVQGQSFDEPFVINIAGADQDFLYVAISRCRRLSDVIIINAFVPPTVTPSSIRVFRSENPNPYLVDVDDTMPFPDPPPPVNVMVPSPEEYHMPMTPAYSTLEEAKKVAHALTGNTLHTYIITRDDPMISLMNPSFRVWDSIEDLVANYPIEILHCIHEVIETARPQKISVALSWYKHDQDVQAVMWEMKHILETKLGAKDVVIERADGSCMAFDNKCQLRWMKYARLIVTSHYVDSYTQIDNFTRMLYSGLPDRISSYCRNSELSERCPRMLFSSLAGYQLGSPTEFIDEQDLDLIRDEFCATNVFYELDGELHSCATRLEHDSLNKVFLD